MVVCEVSAQFRGEFFNIANHSNNLVSRINQPNFGGVLSQFDPRQIQLGLKVDFQKPETLDGLSVPHMPPQNTKRTRN